MDNLTKDFNLTDLTFYMVVVPKNVFVAGSMGFSFSSFAITAKIILSEEFLQIILSLTFANHCINQVFVKDKARLLGSIEAEA